MLFNEKKNKKRQEKQHITLTSKIPPSVASAASITKQAIEVRKSISASAISWTAAIKSSMALIILTQ